MMHIAMHVKSTKRLPTHNVIYSIVQWYLKEIHDLSEVVFWAIADCKTVSSEVLSGSMVVNDRRVPLDMIDSIKKRK